MELLTIDTRCNPVYNIRATLINTRPFRQPFSYVQDSEVYIVYLLYEYTFRYPELSIPWSVIPAVRSHACLHFLLHEQPHHLLQTLTCSCPANSPSHNAVCSLLPLLSWRTPLFYWCRYILYVPSCLLLTYNHQFYIFHYFWFCFITPVYTPIFIFTKLLMIFGIS